MTDPYKGMRLSSKEAANFFKGKGDAGKQVVKNSSKSRALEMKKTDDRLAVSKPKESKKGQTVQGSTKTQ